MPLIGAMSRRKGVRGELEAAKILGSLLNLKLSRGLQFGDRPVPDIDGLPGIHVEVKRCERLNVPKAFEIAKKTASSGRLPLLMHRANRKPWLVTIALSDLVAVANQIATLALDGATNAHEAAKDATNTLTR